jgi:hypothetical protein
MFRLFAVATLTVMFANPLPGEAAENGPSRNSAALQDGIALNGISHNGITADALGSGRLGS